MRSLANPEPLYINAMSTQTRRSGQVYSPLGRGEWGAPAARGGPACRHPAVDRQAVARARHRHHAQGRNEHRVVQTQRAEVLRQTQVRAAGERDHGGQARADPQDGAQEHQPPDDLHGLDHPGAGPGQRQPSEGAQRIPQRGVGLAEHADVAKAMDREQAPEERDPGNGQIEPGLRREPAGGPAPPHPVHRAPLAGQPARRAAASSVRWWGRSTSRAIGSRWIQTSS